MDTNGQKAKIFFKYVQVFYEKACMMYESKEDYKIYLDTECATKVLKLVTLTPKNVENCLSNTFTISGDYTSDNLTLKEDAQRIKILDTHY